MSDYPFDAKTWLEIQLDDSIEKVRRLQEYLGAPDEYIALEERIQQMYQAKLDSLETARRAKRNIVQCKKCLDIIESKHRHDFVRCKCGSIFTDGGNDYQRCGYPGGEDIKEWIEFDESKFVKEDS